MTESAQRRLVPTELAALAAGVKPETIRKWASRGKLTRYGRPGRAEYDLSEIFDLIGPGESVGSTGATERLEQF
ncbi:transcriptional regulator [Nocardia pseudobrasiliensis]|uniref:MerR-like DNA binding protein n=1 Tax=Nocardia pseudobrasiliensis TaxID=45979 RepID=A0A370I086_9NOCA|nr:transcriptional regulator [Nocardia pseudobrasiliensis]RDI64162.1 hypothetical protein DFR76_109505 [Nocardia pseudobrasiliensis]